MLKDIKKKVKEDGVKWVVRTLYAGVLAAFIWALVFLANFSNEQVVIAALSVTVAFLLGYILYNNFSPKTLHLIKIEESNRHMGIWEFQMGGPEEPYCELQIDVQVTSLSDKTVHISGVLFKNPLIKETGSKSLRLKMALLDLTNSPILPIPQGTTVSFSIFRIQS